MRRRNEGARRRNEGMRQRVGEGPEEGPPRGEDSAGFVPGRPRRVQLGSLEVDYLWNRREGSGGQRGGEKAVQKDKRQPLVLHMHT